MCICMCAGVYACMCVCVRVLCACVSARVQVKREHKIIQSMVSDQDTKKYSNKTVNSQYTLILVSLLTATFYKHY